MSPVSTLQATAVVLLFALFPAGARALDNELDADSKPIYCFQCNSGLHPDCPSILANDTASPYYKPCVDYTDYRGATPFCRKIVQDIFEREMVRVIRSCGWERHPKLDCYYNSNDDHTETVCQCFSDGCNAAPHTAASLTAATLATTLALTYSLVSLRDSL